MYAAEVLQMDTWSGAEVWAGDDAQHAADAAAFGESVVAPVRPWPAREQRRDAQVIPIRRPPPWRRGGKA
jgi:hypothetical protein